jgi:phosphatidylglycerol---prolipoprotein diacylglyceryl transferase
VKPLFSIGPFTIHFFGLMIAIGSLSGIFLFLKEAKRRGMNHKLLMDGAMYSLLGGILGARLVYILVYNPSYYFANPLDMLYIHNGGLSIHGGIAGGILVGFLFLKKHRMPIWETLDIVAPSLILAQGISRIGCDVFGGPISHVFPWAVERGGEYLHPAQAYEFLLNYLLFGYLWVRLKSPLYKGQVFLHYIVGYLVIRGIVEFSRVNPMVVGPFSVSHLLSLIGIVIGIIIILLRRKKTGVEKGLSIPKNQYLKTGMYVLLLSIFSLLLYYIVQG